MNSMEKLEQFSKLIPQLKPLKAIDSGQDLLTASLIDEDELDPENIEEFKMQAFPTLRKERKRITNLVWTTLNPHQRKAFLKLHELFSQTLTMPKDSLEKPAIVSIDSRPGTGKTYLIASLSISHHLPISVIVYRRNLANSMNNFGNIIGSTNTAFVMRVFGFHFKQRISQYALGGTEVDALFKYLMIFKKLSLYENLKTIILDEYTVVSPDLIILLYMYSCMFRVNLIYCGDAQQQNSIETSNLHQVSNAYLLRYLCKEHIKLQKIMRCQDEIFNAKLNKFRKLIQFKGTGNTTFYFNIEYSLFRDFKDAYFCPSDLYATYMAYKHQQLTDRVKNYVAFLKETETEFFIAPYYGKSSAKVMVNGKLVNVDTRIVLSVNRIEKYYPALILVPGQYYICNLESNYGIVQLIEVITDQKGLPSSLIVKNSKDIIYSMNLMTIAPCQLLESFSDYLKRDPTYMTTRCSALIQFGLSPLYICTFHGAQGLTLNTNIEIDTRGASCESIYVGLSRITESRMLKRIQSKRIISLYVTYLFEKYFDENSHFYSIPLSLKFQQYINKSFNKILNFFLHKFIFKNEDDVDKKIKIMDRILDNIDEFITQYRKNIFTNKDEIYENENEDETFDYIFPNVKKYLDSAICDFLRNIQDPKNKIIKNKKEKELNEKIKTFADNLFENIDLYKRNNRVFQEISTVILFKYEQPTEIITEGIINNDDESKSNKKKLIDKFERGNGINLHMIKRHIYDSIIPEFVTTPLMRLSKFLKTSNIPKLVSMVNYNEGCEMSNHEILKSENYLELKNKTHGYDEIVNIYNEFLKNNPDIINMNEVIVEDDDGEEEENKKKLIVETTKLNLKTKFGNKTDDDKLLLDEPPIKCQKFH